MSHVWKQKQYLIFQLIFLFFKIIGLAPFSMRVTTTQGGDRLRLFWYSYVGPAYNVICIIVVCILSCSSIQAVRNTDFAYKTETVGVIETTKSIAGVMILLIIWIYACLKQRKAVKIVNRILDVDNAMAKLKHICFPDYPNCPVLLVVGVNLFIWVNLVWMDIVEFEKLVGPTFVAVMVPNIVFNWCLIQYSLVLMTLEMRFHAINRGIWHLFMTNCSLVSVDRSIVKNLLAMKTSHEILYDICCEVTDLYSLPVLLIITALCGAIVNSSYYLIMPFLLNAKDIILLATIDGLVYLAMEVFPIIVLSTSVNRVTHEIKLTAGAIHKLLTIVTDRQLKSELKIFSLELLHRQIQFTGCGIFSLDCTLLHSIANMTATYLVILIQFQSDGKKTHKLMTTDEKLMVLFNSTCIMKNTTKQYELETLQNLFLTKK